MIRLHQSLKAPFCTATFYDFKTRLCSLVNTMSSSMNGTEEDIQKAKEDLITTNNLIQLTLTTRSLAFVVWTIGLLAIGLRFLSRKISRSGIWWDDWLVLPVLVGLRDLWASRV